MVFGPPPGAPAHGAYHASGRCPACAVPPLAPHLDSCEYAGVWRGEVPDEVRGRWDDDIDYDGVPEDD